MGKALFVTGTGTDVGKTYVTALIVKKLREAGLDAGYYKAALSGAEETAGRLVPGDAKFVYDTAAIEGDPAKAVSYIYKTAVSPHLASRIEGGPVDMEAVRLRFSQRLRECAYLTMEGSGGIVCPIRWDEQKILLGDIIKMLGLRCVIVSGSALGSINDAVLTAEYMKQHGIEAAGFILNGWQPESAMHRDDRDMIEQLTGLPVLCAVRRDEKELPMDAARLAQLYR